MKTRWNTFFGRMGCVLLVVGLGLVWASTLPPAFSAFSSRGTCILGAETCEIPHILMYIEPIVYSPRMGLHVSVSSGNSLEIYVLSVHYLQLTEWIAEHFTDMGMGGGMREQYNVSVFQAFLQMRPEEVLLVETVEAGWSIDFFPSKMTNLTIVVSNPSLTRVHAEINISGRAALVTSDRLFIPAGIVTFSGAALIVPWALQKRRRKRFQPQRKDNK